MVEQAGYHVDEFKDMKEGEDMLIITTFAPKKLWWERLERD